MSSSVGAQEEILQKLRSNAIRGKWTQVLETYKQEGALRTAKITVTGDTVLHMAVLSEQEKVVADMVDFLVQEENNNLAQNNLVVIVGRGCEESQNINIVLGAENDRKNTPLHFAARKGNVEMCRKISGRDLSLITRRNIVGETPLFLAALYGRKEAFLWLHYLYMESLGDSLTDFSQCVRDNEDTILHCAIAEGHFDVAIEIIHLYKDHMKEMTRRNKEGLSPIHLLAAKRLAFESTGLLELSILSRLIYRLCKIEEKNQATKLEELPKKNRENILVKFIKSMDRFLRILRPSLLAGYLALVFAEDQANIWLPFLGLFLQLSHFAAGEWLRYMQRMKETHTWTLHIMNELVQHASDEDMSQITSRSAAEQLSTFRLREELTAPEPVATTASGAIIIETPLMIAAKNGVVEMVEKILELFPLRIKDVNAEGKNILLLAVEHRQTKVFRFLCKQEWLSESLFGQVDREGNNALHLAARLGVELDWFNPGEALSMIEEDNWLQYVNDSIPRGLLGRYNMKMETPEDIFRESHKELMKIDAKWVAKTSQACSMMSTIVLSAAFTTCTNVPGGYDDKAGYAILRSKSVFREFGGYSSLAFFFSLISTICFLSLVCRRPRIFRYWKYVRFMNVSGMFFMSVSVISLSFSFISANSLKLHDNSEKWHNMAGILIALGSSLYLSHNSPY